MNRYSPRRLFKVAESKLTTSWSLTTILNVRFFSDRACPIYRTRHATPVRIVVLLATAVFAVNLMAFEIKIHHAITMKSLMAITANVAGVPKKFSMRALDEITKANEATDSRVT
jgi:redox-regulated HSP33 family molecular chaperone